MEEQNEIKQEEIRKQKENKSSNSKIVVIILIILILILLTIPIILLSVGILSFNQIIKIPETVEVVEETKDIIKEEFFEKSYVLKNGEYWLHEEEPDKAEISFKDYSGEKKIKQIQFETGLYDIELIKGENIGVSYNNYAASEINFSINFSKPINRFSDLYIDTEYLKDDENIREGYDFYPTIEVYTFDEDGNKITAKDAEIKITKLNKKVGERPVSQNKEDEIILNEKQDGAYNSAYIVGEDKLTAGTYDIICLEASTDTIRQVFRIVPKGKQFNERFYRTINLNDRKPETKYIKSIKLIDGDQVFFGTPPMGFEGMDEDFVVPTIVPLKLLFIKKSNEIKRDEIKIIFN